jgi:hypothetical protein
LIKSVLRATAVACLTVIAGCTQQATTSTPSAPLRTSSSQPATAIRLVWSHTGKFFGDTQVWYVARVTNPGSSPASVALNSRALDSSGTIVGSSQETLPNIPARTSFDYFGYLGGGGALDTKLTGTPAKIEISRATDAFGRAGSVELPMLGTSEMKLAAGSDDTYTDASLSYNMSVKVTNTTGQEMTTGVTQQVVLYDRAGNVVGGDTGSSDNVPDDLPAGMSYREDWTGIPALHPATRAIYTVWPAS